MTDSNLGLLGVEEYPVHLSCSGFLILLGLSSPHLWDACGLLSSIIYVVSYIVAELLRSTADCEEQSI